MDQGQRRSGRPVKDRQQHGKTGGWFQRQRERGVDHRSEGAIAQPCRAHKVQSTVSILSLLVTLGLDAFPHMSPLPTAAAGQSDAHAFPGFPPCLLVAVEGMDATAFLQGQLTCDVASLAAGTWSWFGYCTPAGRLLATGRLACVDSGLYLQVPEPLGSELAQRLQRFVLRSRVRIRTLDKAVGRARQAPESARDEEPLPEPGTVRVSDGVLTLGVAPQLAIAHPLSEDALPGVHGASAAEAIRVFEVRNGAPWVVSATREMFIPQMLGLDAAGGVSFTKGCYPGQEIVARARYRGTVKRGPYLATAQRPLAPGAGLCSARFGAQQAGIVVQSVADGPAWLVHAVIDHSAAREGLTVQSGGDALSDVRALHEPV